MHENMRKHENRGIPETSPEPVSIWTDVTHREINDPKVYREINQDVGEVIEKQKHAQLDEQEAIDFINLDPALVNILRQIDDQKKKSQQFQNEWSHAYQEEVLSGNAEEKEKKRMVANEIAKKKQQVDEKLSSLARVLEKTLSGVKNATRDQYVSYLERKNKRNALKNPKWSHHITDDPNDPLDGILRSGNEN